jgi:hypothetical protein
MCDIIKNKTHLWNNSSEPFFTPSFNHNHECSYPVFVLVLQLQAAKKISKWYARSRLGVYLGPSLHHGRSMGLVLCLASGIVPPTFHKNNITSFTTVDLWSVYKRVLVANKCGWKEVALPQQIMIYTNLSTTLSMITNETNVTSLNQHIFLSSEGEDESATA